MNTKRVLLTCTVISLQDTSFVYPCCKFCLAKLIVESNLRSRCLKCGSTCDTQNVEYRFRLSLKVSRDTSLFGVTVFGGCLNPFFGITAGGLQRFLESEKFDGPHTLHQLLIKAVEDCFIGKSLVFGFKLTGRDAESCLLGEHTAGSVQFVACQVIPPHAACLGISVFAYLQSLMQANARSDCSLNACSERRQEDSLLCSIDYTLPLCQNSYFESSNEGLTNPHVWHSVSSLVLCISSEEARGSSLPEALVDDESQDPLVLLSCNGVQAAQFCPVEHSESKHRECNRHSASLESSFQLNVISLSPVKSIQSDHESKSLCFNHWASKDGLDQFTTSFPENPLFSHTSFDVEDAPLSETLGDFVVASQIVNQKVLHSTNKRGQTTPQNSVLLESITLSRDSSEVPSIYASPPVLTPLRDVTNAKKSLENNKRKRKSSSTSKHRRKLSHVSEELYSRHNVVLKRNRGPNVQCCAKKELESQSSGYEDAYNCSADLFHQSSMSILDGAESSVSDADLKKQDSLPGISVSEPGSLSFPFAPALQSTPVVDPSMRCVHGQRQKPGKKWSSLRWSEKRITRISHVNTLQNNANNTHGLQVGKPAFDQTSAGGFELKAGAKHTLGDFALNTPTNDCSRDLFDSSF